MFHKSEQFYDAIYEWKDYKAEATRLKQLISANKQSSGCALLDVACGTGGHIPHLGDTFAIEGVDLDPQMLEIARAKYPRIPFHRGDMADFDLGRQFDVVVSLFSSIGYLRTPDRLTLAVANMARHVRPGGVLIIEPYFSPAAWKPRTRAPGANMVDKPDITIIRMIDWVQDGNIIKSKFHYLIGTMTGVEHFIEVHEMGLFTDEEHRDAFTAAGMDVTYDETGLMGRGLYIGTWASRRAGERSA
jgi:SAM-dependent methyltransferase